MAVDIYYSCDCTNEEDEDEDEYIDMEVNPLYNTNNNNSLLHPLSPPPPPHPQSDDYGHHHQFEFQMSTASHSLDHTPLPTSSPADELFYMGKLLPLHLPPRLHTIESILRATSFRSKSDELLITPTTTTTTTSTPITPVTTTTTTPFLSCTASPVESRHFSGEILNREEYLRDYTNGDYSGGGGEYEHQLMVEISDESDSEEMISESRRSWVRKLSMIKHVLIGSKLKGSRAYLRNMFNKSVCSHRSSASVAMMNNDIIKPPPVLKENFNKQRKNPAAVADTSSAHENETKQQTTGPVNASVNESGISSKICHRRSFSGVFKRRQSASMAKISASSSSTSSSFSSSTSSGSGNSNGGDQVKVVLKRSGTTTTAAAPSNNITVIECPIQGAIAYCKRSNNDQDVVMMKSRKTLSEVGFLSGFGFHDSSSRS